MINKNKVLRPKWWIKCLAEVNTFLMAISACMNVISHPSCIMYSLTSGLTLLIKSNLHRSIAFGLDVLHRLLSTSLFIFHTLLISSLVPLCYFLFFISISLTPLSSHFILSHRVVSHFCSLPGVKIRDNISGSLIQSFQKNVSNVLHHRDHSLHHISPLLIHFRDCTWDLCCKSIDFACMAEPIFAVF